MRYYPRGSAVKAIRWREGNTAEVLEFLHIPPTDVKVEVIKIGSPLGPRIIRHGYWIVEDRHGDFHIYGDRDFTNTFAPVINII